MAQQDKAPDVEHLVLEIQAGHSKEEHFQVLFRHYFPSVTHYFLNRGISNAEDLAQEVLFSVYRNVEKFRLKASFNTWVFQIATNVWKNALRSQDALKRRAEEISLEESVPDVEPPDPVCSPLEQAMAEERTTLLHAALDELPPKMRQCTLAYLRGLSYREIGELLGVSVTTVKTHLKSTRKRLQPILEEYFDGADFETRRESK
jgi:RNA polymerase sigma-70 factor (ECF subfamily)